MSNSTKQTDISLVFTDHEQNYYVIPVEVFERGRVPADRKAEVERLMSEHRDDVSGHLVGVVVAMGIVVSGAVAGVVGAGGFAFGAGTSYAGWRTGEAIYDALTDSGGGTGNGDTPVVYREG